MKLNYYIEFAETIDNVNDITDEELMEIKYSIEQHLKKYVTLSGAQIENFNLNFDLEE